MGSGADQGLQGLETPVQGHLDRRYAHVPSRGGFHHGQTLDPDIPQQGSLAGGELAQQHVKIAPGHGPLVIIRGRQIVIFAQGLRRASPLAAPGIDKLVACNGLHPGQEGLGGVIQASLQMNGQQGFLHKILRLCRIVPHAPGEKPPQPRGQGGQQPTMRGLVAPQTGQHQRFQLRLRQGHPGLLAVDYGGGTGLVTDRVD